VPPNSVITHTPSGRTTTYGKVVEAAARLEPPTDVKLKDPKDWKLIGKSVKRLDTSDKTTGTTVYGIDIKLPGMLNAAIKDCPVFGGKLKSFDEAKVAGMKGVKKVVRVGGQRSCRRCRHLVACQDRARRLADRMDEGDNAKVSSASIAKWLDEGLDDSQAAFVGKPERRCQGRICERRQEGRGGLQLSVPEPRHIGAAERYRALYIGQMRGLVRNAKRRKRFRGCAGSVRASGRQMRRPQADGRRRLRTSRPDRLCPAGGGDRQADAGHPIKLLWSREEDMQHGKYHPDHAL